MWFARTGVYYGRWWQWKSYTTKPIMIGHIVRWALKPSAVDSVRLFRTQEVDYVCAQMSGPRFYIGTRLPLLARIYLNKHIFIYNKLLGYVRIYLY